MRASGNVAHGSPGPHGSGAATDHPDPTDPGPPRITRTPRTRGRHGSHGLHGPRSVTDHGPPPGPGSPRFTRIARPPSSRITWTTPGQGAGILLWFEVTPQNHGASASQRWSVLAIVGEHDALEFPLRAKIQQQPDFNLRGAQVVDHLSLVTRFKRGAGLYFHQDDIVHDDVGEELADALTPEMDLEATSPCRRCACVVITNVEARSWPSKARRI